MSKKSDTIILTETATTMRLMNERLFGGNGQEGAIHFIMEQHKELSAKMESNKQELLDRIEGKKAETDADVKALTERVDSVSTKVNWFAASAATVGSVITFLLTAFGIYHRTH